ncbi:unnamed protein product [Schistocephalus solidus]|uniref:Hexosyltransferase n=1 Tax=Schistocephalus solidus TaxID=70667 RepID=A0A183TQ76_SCHSO|nr:unnamed protein product [Schistocephalus solidus]
MLAIFMTPVNNYTIRFLNITSAICPSEGNGIRQTQGQDFIVIVKSGVYNFRSRRQIRVLFKDMIQEGLALGSHLTLVFSVGLPRRNKSNFFERDGFNISLPGRAGEALRNAQPIYADIMHALRKETEIHDDLLVGDFEDTYYNLTLKMHYTFTWAARFCRPEKSPHQNSPLFIFLDDDFSFNVANLLRVLKSTTSQVPPKRVLIGNNRRYSDTIRSAAGVAYRKWALSKREMPSPQLPSHCNGAFYILDYTSLEEIAISMYFTKTIPLDDVWLGLVMTRLGLEFNKLHPNIYNPLTSADANTAIFASLEVFFNRRHKKRLLEPLPVRRRNKNLPKTTLSTETSSLHWSTL